MEQNIHLPDGLHYLYGEPLSVYATCSRGIVTPGVDAKPEYDTDDHSTAGIRSPYGDALKSLKLAFAANESMITLEK